MKPVMAGLACLVCLQAEDTGVLRKMSENQFAPMAGLSPCVSLSVENGDPTKGPALILFKATSGCKIPWHWHTPAENVMMVSGSAKVEMKDGNAAAVLGPGGYAMMPSKHVHQFICESACTVFLYSDGQFDIHYVDANGNEIPPDAALATKK